MTIGIETQVNTYTTGTQWEQEITTLADGGWVVTWSSQGQDGSGYGVYSQVYNADGTTQGGETRVSTFTAGNQTWPEIAALNDGGWVITWVSTGQDGVGWGVYSQAYNDDGTPKGVETQVNTFTSNNQTLQKITALTDGGWVITWASFGQDGESYGVYAQAYNADGTVQGGETQINTYTPSSQQDPQITALSDGGWVITWLSIAQDGGSYDIYAQAFDVDGTPQGVETQVNTFTTSIQIGQQIAALSDGGWVITWRSSGQDGDSYGIYAQAYDADGTARGVETQVNTYTTSVQLSQQIAALADGGWVITWQSNGQDGDNYGIYAQVYNADGTPQGIETQVNTYTTSVQNNPKITALSDGGWVITWQSNGQDGDGSGIYAQAFNADGTPQGGELQVNTNTAGIQDDPRVTALPDGGWVITWRSNLQDGDEYGVYSRTFRPLTDADLDTTLSGTQEVGETLTAETPGIDPTDPTVTLTYLWIVDGEVVETTTRDTFTLTEVHAGKVITVTILATDTLFDTTGTQTAPATNPIDDGNNDPTGAVTLISDNADPDTFALGDTATADTSTLADADGLGTFSYQWMRGNVAIDGATASTYLITAADEGYKLRVVITYTDLAGFDEDINSDLTRVEGYSGIDESGTILADVMNGTALDDRLKGLHGDDLLVGGQGRDILAGDHGDDTMIAGTGRDKLIAGKGDDLLIGGGGRDVFLFGMSSGNDTVMDYEDGVDRLRIKGGANDFHDLTVTQVGDDVLVTYASASITIRNALEANITDTDFVF